MTTLADMTQKERNECNGMWCVTIPNRPHSVGGMMCILLNSDDDTASVITPRGILCYPPNDELEPLPDLPRAWNPDGTPPAGKWEERDGAEYRGGGYFEYVHAPLRRWISEWEELP